MLTTAFGMCAIPFCKQALLLTALMSVIGMSMGVLDTGELKELFGQKGGKRNSERLKQFTLDIACNRRRSSAPLKRHIVSVQVR